LNDIFHYISGNDMPALFGIKQKSILHKKALALVIFYLFKKTPLTYVI